MAHAPWLRFLAETAVAMASFLLALLTALLLYLAPTALLVPFSDLELHSFPPGPWSRVLSDLIEYGLVDFNQPMSSPPVLRTVGLIIIYFSLPAILLLLPGMARRAHGWGRVFCGHLAIAVSLFLWGSTLGSEGMLAGAIWQVWSEQDRPLPLSIGLFVAILVSGWAVYGALRPLVASGVSEWRTLELARWVVLPTALCVAMGAGVGAALLLVVFELAQGLPAALRRPALPKNRPGRKGALVILRAFTIVAAFLLGFQPDEEVALPGSSVLMRGYYGFDPEAEAGVPLQEPAPQAAPLPTPP